MIETISRFEWAEALEDFTRRNAGRRTVLEVDDPEIGAQWEESDYPLRGVSYDPQDHRIQIMLGDQASVEHRLTHSIADATDVTLLFGPDGRDQVLAIQQQGGQTLLRLVPR